MKYFSATLGILVVILSGFLKITTKTNGDAWYLFAWTAFHILSAFAGVILFMRLFEDN